MEEGAAVEGLENKGLDRVLVDELAILTVELREDSIDNELIEVLLGEGTCVKGIDDEVDILTGELREDGIDIEGLFNGVLLEEGVYVEGIAEASTFTDLLCEEGIFEEDIGNVDILTVAGGGDDGFWVKEYVDELVPVNEEGPSTTGDIDGVDNRAEEGDMNGSSSDSSIEENGEYSEGVGDKAGEEISMGRILGGIY